MVDGADLTLGAKADAAWTSGSGSVVALLKAIAAVEVAAAPVHTIVDSGPASITANQGTASATPWLTALRNQPGYSSAIFGLVPPASATDIFEIKGSGTKTVKIVRIRVSCVATAAAVLDIGLVKRSTANTSGTSTAPTIVPVDSADAAATAAVKAYTANPTTGTLVGLMRADKITCSTPTSSAVQSDILLYGDDVQAGGRAITLRGTAESIALNLNGVSPPAGILFNISEVHTEE